MELEAYRIRAILRQLLNEIPVDSRPSSVRLETAVADIIRVSAPGPLVVRCDFD